MLPRCPAAVEESSATVTLPPPPICVRLFYCFTSCSQAQLLVLLTKILHPNIFRASVSQTLILCYRTGHMLHVCMYIYDIKSIMIIADISDLLLARMMSCLFLAQTILILN